MVKYYYETEGKYGRREKVMNKDMDYDALRNDLEDYYGTAMFGGAGVAMGGLSDVESAGVAMGGLSDVESASDDRLIEIAARERINLGKYEK